MTAELPGSEKFRLSKQDRLLVIIVNVGALVTMFSQTMMTPAMPAVMREFAIDASIGQWLTTIASLVSGIMVPVSAYLIGRFSTRQIFSISLIVYLVGTVVCGFSPTFGVLIFGRVLQSLGMGAIMPFSAVVIMLVYPKARRGFALGINGIVIGAGPAGGPVIAGLLVDSFGWRFVFHIIAPFAAISLVLALILLRNLNTAEKMSLDWWSVIESTIAFGGLLLGFSMAGSVGWLSPVPIISIIIGTIFFVLYVKRQLKLKTPVLELGILRNRVFSISVVLTMLLQTGMVVGLVHTPLYLQDALGQPAFVSGLTVLPAALVMVGISPFTGLLFDKYGIKTLVLIGMLLTTVGTGLLALVSLDTSLHYVMIVYTLRMAGMGFVNMPLNAWGINALPNSKIAHGNAVTTTARMVSSSFGTAILVTLMMMVQNANMNLGAAAALAKGVDFAFAIATATMVISFIVAVAAIEKESKQ
jgi:EmrB/QacA subfamily drug resistance transporter